MDDASFRPAEIIAALERHGVRYVIIGGLAATLHGSPLSTTDADICPARDRDNLERLARALNELRARIRTPDAPDGLSFGCDATFLSRIEVALNLTTRFGDLDLSIVPSGTSGFEDLRPQAITMSLAGRSVAVASLEDVIRSKEAHEVDFWTSRAVQEAERCHLSYVVLDTATWEQTTAFYLDSDPHVVAFVKNANLGFSIPYAWRGVSHEYHPDFLARLRDGDREVGTLILETKGFDPRTDVKVIAARRWVAAVNGDGGHGRWAYRLVSNPAATREALVSAARELGGPLPVPWREALNRFAVAVRAAYGERLSLLVLYGSRARGDADADSDVDVLVVLDRYDDFWTEQRRIGDIAIQASDGAETIVSATPMSRRDFEDGRSPLLLNIRREGVLLA